MRIAMLATSDFGGAHSAAIDLMRGLNKMADVECVLYAHHLEKGESDVTPMKQHNKIFSYIQEKYFINNVYPKHTMLSLMYSDTETEYLEAMEHFDIVHLQWIANFVSMESIRYMSDKGKPLVWTLHDRNPMTGGCHCTFGCEGYLCDCRNCPQLQWNPYDITKSLLELKKRYLPAGLVVVAPSQWMADCARKSQVFKNHRIEIIPNSVNLDEFYNFEKSVARKSLGISPASKIILYSAVSIRLLHKGYDYLVKAVRHAMNIFEMKTWLEQNQVEILLLGQGSEAAEKLKEIGFPVYPLGYVADKKLLSQIYAAADITVLPSLEDNLPNVMLESLACGTPVVGFATGGIPDLIQTGYNGIVVPQGDVTALGRGIVQGLCDYEMRKNCREYAERNLAIHLQVQRYKALYDDILPSKKINISMKGFRMPNESLQVLSPYYHEAVQHFGKMDSVAWLQWVGGKAFEDKVIHYIIGKLSRQREDYPDGSLAIWGCGDFAKRFVTDLLDQRPDYRRKIHGFVQTGANVGGFMGYPLLSEEQLLEYGLRVVIIASLRYEDEIYRQAISRYDERIQFRRLGKEWMERMN